jgi:hypothetical protein
MRASRASAALENVRAPEVKRERRQLEADTDQDEQNPHDDDGVAHQVLFADRFDDRRQEPRTDVIMPDDKADAVKHDAGSAAAVDDVLERRLAPLAPAFQKAGHRITRQARHLNADKNHQKMIGGGHHRHADGRTEQEAVEVGGVFAVRDFRHHGQEDEERDEHVKEHFEEDGEVVVDQHAAEQIERVALDALVRARIQRGDAKPEHDAQGARASRQEKRDRTKVHMVVARNQAAQKQENDAKR